MNLHSYLYPDKPEQEQIETSKEFMDLLMKNPSQIGSVIQSINELSDKIDENQRKSEEQAIKQQHIETKRFYITVIIASISALAAVLSFIVSLS